MTAPGPTPDTAIKIGRGISLRKVAKRYGDALAVEDLDLEILPGELVTLLGPSGSGKTTTLMMIAGFILPTDGEIWVGERDVTHLSPHRRGVGVVFQQYALFPHMTVAENIAFPLAMRHVSKGEIAARVARQLELTEMSSLSGRYPAELSGGQQQRVAFARATVFDPPVLLLDEPLGALDKRLRETIQLEIKSMHNRLGLTMIYVTHDQGEALAVSDRVAVMNKGRLEQIGTPEELYEAPRTRFVADFVGDANFLKGTVSGQAGASVTLPGGARIIAPPGIPRGTSGLVEVMIRPERLSILPGHAPDGGGKPNRMTGRVTDRSYVGEASKITILSEDGATMTARIPNVGRAARDIRTGDTVTLGWDPADSLVFPAPGRE